MDSKLKEHPHFEPVAPSASVQPTYEVPETAPAPTAAPNAMSKAMKGEGVAFSELSPQTTVIPAQDSDGLID